MRISLNVEDMISFEIVETRESISGITYWIRCYYKSTSYKDHIIWKDELIELEKIIESR